MFSVVGYYTIGTITLKDKFSVVTIGIIMLEPGPTLVTDTKVKPLIMAKYPMTNNLQHLQCNE